MKKLTVMFSYLQKNLLPLVVIAITMTVSLFLIITTVGEFQYQTYARNVFANSGLENSVYFCKSFDPSVDRNANQWIYDAASEYEAFDKYLVCDSAIDSIDNQVVNVMYQSDDLLQAFKLNVTKGRWLDSNATQAEVVLTGFACTGKHIGDKIVFESGVEATVVGLIEGNSLYLSFNRSSTRMTANNLFESVDSCAFINAEQLAPSCIEQVKPAVSRNAIICYKNDASYEEKMELLKYLEQQGLCYSYETLLENTDEDIQMALRKSLPLPLFLLIIMSISVICVGAVIVQRTMPEQAKYYLVGCSKKEGVRLITGALFVAFMVPVLINVLLAIFFPDFLRIGAYQEPEYIINIFTLLPMVGYAIIMLMFLSLLPWLFFKKQSPIQVYRRNLL